MSSLHRVEEDGWRWLDLRSGSLRVPMLLSDPVFRSEPSAKQELLDINYITVEIAPHNDKTHSVYFSASICGRKFSGQGFIPGRVSYLSLPITRIAFRQTDVESCVRALLIQQLVGEWQRDCYKLRDYKQAVTDLQDEIKEMKLVSAQTSKERDALLAEKKKAEEAQQKALSLTFVSSVCVFVGIMAAATGGVWNFFVPNHPADLTTMALGGGLGYLTYAFIAWRRRK